MILLWITALNILISIFVCELISQPYLKSAIFFYEDGTTFEKTYTRIDFKKPLHKRGI